MKMCRNTIGVTIFLLAVMSISTAFAMGPRLHNRHPEAGGMMFEMMKDLELSDEQKASIAGIIRTYRDQMENFMDTLKMHKQEMQGIFFADEFIEEDARESFRRISLTMEDFGVLRLKMFAEIKSVLYPEQISTLKAKMNEKMNMMEKRKGKMHEKMDSWLDQFPAE
jgi:Spy/CpxP family protein refolding chaperone